MLGVVGKSTRKIHRIGSLIFVLLLVGCSASQPKLGDLALPGPAKSGSLPIPSPNAEVQSELSEHSADSGVTGNTADYLNGNTADHLAGNIANSEGPTPGGKYILGPGDRVDVVVWGHPELSGKRIIGPDGEIQIPFVGSFRVAGLSADDAGGKLTGALQEDYLWTAVSVSIDTYGSNRVVVLGHVGHPGVLTFSGTPTLLEALALAGTPGGANKDGGGELPLRCAIIRGRDRIMWVDLRPLSRSTTLTLNVPLQRNDLVYVPDPNDQLVYVMGQVKNPGPYPITANMSFLEALSRAGGPNDGAAQGKIILARPNQNFEKVVDLEDVVQKGGDNYQLEPGDIVYVPKSGLAKLGYVFQQISPITTMALFAAAL